MIRPFVFGVVSLFAATAAAEPTSSTSTSPHQGAPVTATGELGQRIAVPTPSSAFVPHALISQTLYLERCLGGCTVRKGGLNDARTSTSTIPQPGSLCSDPASGCNISEFVGTSGTLGAQTDQEWAEIVQCVREVYSPYQVTVTDVKPAAGVTHHLAILAGNPGEIGLDNDILGIAPLATDCSPQDNVISFSFANHHSRVDPQRVFSLCHTVSQESAHAFGLDHSFAFQDGRSSCNDPMTYRGDCGGQRFFRNDVATCGEFEARPCRCGANQNSHLKIQSVFGAATPITGNPTSQVTLPVANTTLGAVVGAMAGSKRGVAKVELRLNGFKWAEAKGALFGVNGQPNPSAYTIQVPPDVPGGRIDVVVRAFDDLGAFADSAPVTVLKGPPCTSADQCALGQKCENDGRCFWDPPTGAIGDSCDYPQFCESLLCSPTAENKICTQQCIVGVDDSCPEDMTCIANGANPFCYYPPDGGSCCSIGEGGSAWFHAGLGLGLVGFLARRRRK